MNYTTMWFSPNNTIGITIQELQRKGEEILKVNEDKRRWREHEEEWRKGR